MTDQTGTDNWENMADKPEEKVEKKLTLKERLALKKQKGGESKIEEFTPPPVLQ